MKKIILAALLLVSSNVLANEVWFKHANDEWKTTCPKWTSDCSIAVTNEAVTISLTGVSLQYPLDFAKCYISTGAGNLRDFKVKGKATCSSEGKISVTFSQGFGPALDPSSFTDDIYFYVYIPYVPRPSTPAPPTAGSEGAQKKEPKKVNEKDERSGGRRDN